MYEVYTSYNSVISPLGFSTEENLISIDKELIGPKSISFGKQNKSFCLSKINSNFLNTKFDLVKNNIAYTKLEKLSILSIQEVLNNSGLSLTDPKTLLIYSTTKGNINLLDEFELSAINKERVYLSEMAYEIAKYFDAANSPLIISNACISGLLAILHAKRLIEAGLYNHIIVCGGDVVSEFTVSGFKSFNALSDFPCKPFDVTRDGINLGEAVSTVLITKNKTKLSKDAFVILNGASANDANHISGPSRTGEGLFKSIQETISAHLNLKIDLINAHGTATPFNDEMESIAFERSGFTQIPINSLKGIYGHTLGAAGVLETVITLAAANKNLLLKSQGFSQKGVSGNVIINKETISQPAHVILKTASGFGGCNAAALFQKL